LPLSSWFRNGKWEKPGGNGDALLVDRAGRVRHRFNGQVVTGIRWNEDRVFLTSSDVTRVSSEDNLHWKIPFDDNEWVAGGGLLELAGGDLLAYLYCGIADSGVQAVRLKASDGKVVWKAACAALGVQHSEYYHRATLAVEGNRVRVTSRGSSGTIVELLDLRSGQQLERTLSDAERRD
jgi:outer membrane protein assembly factor BamB